MLSALVVTSFACSDVAEDRVSSDRVERYRAKIHELVAEDCRRHDTDSSPFAAACESASSDLHERVGELLSKVPATWEKKVLALGGICRGEAYRYAQSELSLIHI